MSDLELLPPSIPTLPDDPIEKVQMVLELLEEVTISVPVSQLAFITHALLVGLSHPQFDHSPNAAAVELRARQWSDDLGRKIPGIKPLFDAGWLGIQEARESRKRDQMPPLPSNIKALKSLAKKLGVKNYWAMSLEELVGSIEKFNPVVISEALSNG